MPTQTDQRQTAIRAARGQARRMGIDPAAIDGAAALCVLDDLARLDPTLAAATWYLNASGRQTRLFCNEWEKWRQEENGR